MNQTSLQSPSRHPAPLRDGAPWRVAVLSSLWHRDIVVRGTEAIRSVLDRAADPPCRTAHFEVPGAFEMPLHAQRLARAGGHDAIIACGLVVNGGIYRHEFVATAVIDGLMRVQLETDTPIFSAVLTPRDFHEHEEHLRFFADHFTKKGHEVARACLDTLAALRHLAAGG